ncbi:hypothetical protein EYF80_037006 [Liparis tanakae]|uniref:Uncharacterized protein n=1 Tax=Liparis tanakae TaxID=230148 RepID=A0A4Z2GIT0_9TELE|nr:hypothetical protein EYF80_037006 [Liparis tanakae]
MTVIVYLNLLVGGDGTEDDLREALSGKHPEADAADDSAIFDKGEGLVLPVKIDEIRAVCGYSTATGGKRTSTHGSNTRRVMYSLGMRAWQSRRGRRLESEDLSIYIKKKECYSQYVYEMKPWAFVFNASTEMQRLTSGPSIAAGSVIVIMTSLTSSIGMSPITRIRLASSRVNASGTRGENQRSGADRPVMGSAAPASMLPREEMLPRPLGSAGEPDTAAGLITAMRGASELASGHGEDGLEQAASEHRGRAVYWPVDSFAKQLIGAVLLMGWLVRPWLRLTNGTLFDSRLISGLVDRRRGSVGSADSSCSLVPAATALAASALRRRILQVHAASGSSGSARSALGLVLRKLLGCFGGLEHNKTVRRVNHLPIAIKISLTFIAVLAEVSMKSKLLSSAYAWAS